MLFTKLKLNYFGRFLSREIELKPGINLVYGDNEAGKSTIHTFIKGMLFGIERARGRGAATKDDLYTRYLPWDYPGAFNGSMDIRIGDKEYRLQRSFHANDKYFTILDLSTGREIKLKEGLISELIPGLTESTFKNTISIEQLKAQTDVELAAQVRNYIANLSIAKSKEVNVAKAVGFLSDQRKQLEPSQNMAALKALQTEITDGLEKEERIDQLTIKLKELLTKEHQLKEQKETLGAAVDNEDTKRMEQLPAIIEKYRSYQELLKQAEGLAHQEKELRGKITSWEMEQLATSSLKDDIKEAEQLRSQLIELEKQELELQREKTLFMGMITKNRVISIVPASVIAVLIAVLSGFQLWGIGVAAVLLITGISILLVRDKTGKKKIADIELRENNLRSKKTDCQVRTDEILNKNQVARVEVLTEKQEAVLKNYYTLESERLKLKELEERIKELEDNRDVLYETIMKYIQYFIREEELSNLSIQKLQEEIRRRRQETQGRLTELVSQYDACRMDTSKLRGQLSAMEGNEEQLLKNQVRYSELEQKQRENAVELDAIKLALSTLQELSTDIHDTFGQQLNQAVSEVISEVTGQKYSDLKVDEKLDVKVGWNGDYVLLDRLSAGTIDQVYFALRLAVADLLLGKDEIPLLLDDSFALYDEVRVKAALAKISQNKQIVLFTCHRREQEFLKEMGIPYHLVDLSCR